MNKIKTSIAVLVIPLLLFSCSRMEEQRQIQGQQHAFSVNAKLPEIEQEPDTRGYLGSFISASWNEGDKISVVNLTTGKILGGYLSPDKAGSQATISGTVTGTISNGDEISLFYPSFENEEETEFTNRNVSLANQSKTSNVPLVAYSTFTASSDNGEFSDISLNFYYILSYLKINMANLPAEAAVSKISLHNIPNQLSLSINDTKDGFDVATDDEKAAKGRIELSGPFTTSASGALAVAVGVMPSDESAIRSIIVTADASGDYYSPLTAAKLQSHEYYNTIASQFELIGLPGQQEYGIYNMESSAVIDRYEDFTSTVITGLENDESDFTLLNSSASSFWTLKGIPSDAAEGTTFTARVYTNEVDYPSNTILENAKICTTETDGDFTKLWVKAGNTLEAV